VRGRARTRKKDHEKAIGWLRGVEAADFLTSDVIMNRLWPTGHWVGSIVIEVDVQCRKPANNKQIVSVIIIELATEKHR
jgi:hypothetical protein